MDGADVKQGKGGGGRVWCEPGGGGGGGGGARVDGCCQGR